MARYTLPISPNYVKDWGVNEAIRELLQNAIDQESLDSTNKKSIEIDDSLLRISNLKSKLEKSTLLLGGGTKDGTNTIGQFGEGYKVALLVLLREGFKVSIKNYGICELWTPKIVKSRVYNSDVLAIDTQEYVRGTTPNSLEIEIEHPTHNFESSLSEIWLDEMEHEVMFETTKGRILNLKGHIFINGLLVSVVDKLSYGYDFKPNILKVGRDRNIVSGFDLQLATRDMWKEVKDYDLVLDLIKSSAYDVEYLNEWGLTTEFKDRIRETYKDKYVVTSQSDSELIKKTYGKVTTEIVPQLIRDVVYSGETYEQVQSIKYKSTSELLEDFMEQFSEHLTDEMTEELEFIISRC